MKSAKKILALAVSAMMLVSMTACGSGNGNAGGSADSGAAGGETFKLGGIGPLTGALPFTVMLQRTALRSLLTK